MRDFFRSNVFVVGFVSLVPAMILFMDGITVTITRLNLTIYSRELSCFYMCGAAVWMCCSPWRGSCRAWWQQVLFCLVPTEFLLLFIFAQYHILIAAVLLMIWIVACMAVKIMVRRSTIGLQPRSRAVRTAKRQTGRFGVGFLTVLTCVPCFFSLFIYHAEDPVYKANQAMLTWLKLAYEDHVAEGDDIYEANTELFSYFEEETWDGLDAEERITAVQALVDFECEEVLGSPTVTIFSESISSAVLGYYDGETESICINLDLLEEADARNCLETVCHEAFHVYQDYLIESIDWEDEITQTYYFSQAREWVYNSENYVPGSLTTYDAYADQDLEASAEAFGEEEAEKILSMIPD